MLPTKISLLARMIPLTNSVTISLSQAGYKVLQVRRGMGALDLIQAEKPILVIIDKHLPDFNSLSIIRALRSEEIYDQTAGYFNGFNDARGGCLDRVGSWSRFMSS